MKGLTRPDMLRKSGTATPATSVPSIKPASGSKYILSTEVRNILRAVFANEQRRRHVFLQALIVPPTRFRLPSKLGDEIHENTQNELLSAVLKTSLLIKDLNDQIAGHHSKEKASSAEARKVLFNRLMNAFVTIQNDVNAFIDASKNQNAAAGKI
ncbi:hypothetical protein OXX69_013319, partial [Metschnikowia pulcherrima]